MRSRPNPFTFYLARGTAGGFAPLAMPDPSGIGKLDPFSFPAHRDHSRSHPAGRPTVSNYQHLVGAREANLGHPARSISISVVHHAIACVLRIAINPLAVESADDVLSLLQGKFVGI